MTKTQNRGQLDWLVEVAGAAAPAVAASFAAAWLAPVSGWPVPGSVAATGAGVFLAAYGMMRAVPAEARHLPIAEFGSVEFDDELLLDRPLAPRLEELLLDRPWVDDASAAVAELLLDDPLPEPAPDSRVVQLFADGRMPTAGQLKHRIDRHLAEGGKAVPTADASDALSEALAELRRSLRQA